MSAMRRRHKRKGEPQELELTTFLNVLVVLISFLLVTAVFSRLAIQELKLPASAAEGEAPAKPLVTIEVIVRKTKIEIGDGRRVVETIPKTGDDQYDLARLSLYLQDLKSKYSDKTDATLLVEPDIAYNDMVRVMDVLKIARLKQGPNGKDQLQLVTLFTDVSIGDAP